MRVKDLFFVVSGATPSSKVPKFWDGEITWITPADMSDFGSINSGETNISQLGYDSCSTTMCPINSIIISKRAPIGKVNIAQTEYCTNQGCFSLVPKSKQIDSLFYAYYLHNSRRDLEVLGQGTTFSEISYKNIVSFPIPEKPLTEQKAIAKYLDEKIEAIDTNIDILTNELILLDKLKRSEISQILTHGLNSNVPMKDSGISWIGYIPKHWEVKRVKEFAKTVKGRQTDYFDEVKDGAMRVLSLEILRQDVATFYDYVIPSDASQICTEEDIVIIWDGAGVGELLKAKNGVLSSTIAKIIFNEKKMLPAYFWQWRYHIEYKMKSIPTGMGIPHLNPNLFYNYLLPVPPIEEQRAIAEYLDEKVTKIDKK